MVKLFLFIFMFLVFVMQAEAGAKKRILILHSYSQEYGWTKLQHNGFVATMQERYASPIEISVEYLDTKRLEFSEEYQAFFRSYLEKKYEDYSPDAIYVTDDNALNFFLNPLNTLFGTSPLFFSGVNNLSLAASLNPMRYSGVYETKEIEPNIELIRQFSPQTHDIWIVGDASTTYKSIELDIQKKISKYPKYKFHFLSSPKIDTILKQLPVKPKSFVLLTTIGGWKDGKGNDLLLKESIQRLKRNPHIILCSMEDAYLVGGVIGGYVTSGTTQGSRAAELMSRHLKGASIQTLQSITKSPNIYMFDHKALRDARLILSEYIARNAVIINGEKTFFIRYQQTIFNTIFILLVIFFLFVLITFLIILQKKEQLKQLKESLEERSVELSMLKEKCVLKESNE